MGETRHILQSMVFSDKCCETEELYLRTHGEVCRNGNILQIKSTSTVSTDTYLNAFDMGMWSEYTETGKVVLCIVFCGKCEVSLRMLHKGEETILCERRIGTKDRIETELAVPEQIKEGIVYVSLRAIEDTTVFSMCYRSCKEELDMHTSLGLVICTYHRPDYIAENLKKLRDTRFFQEGDQLQGKLHVHIVDNASELPFMQESQIELFHNPNTGGSGGFTRGIREFRKRQDSYQLTQMIFMDDDVNFIPETFYRLYAFLSYMKLEYKNQVIAGRMFRTDNRQIQYTAAEIWNGGDLLHIGLNCDMVDRSVLENMNDSTGAEYGGWWFCCFPMPFVMNNNPFPFFLHCDDVEYGLRHGGTPLILNGIQVWHDTYEYRQTPVIRYYDTRNPLIVNAMYLKNQNKEEVYKRWFDAITEAHVQENYQLEYMIIRGMKDFLKGQAYLCTDIQRKCNERICRKKHFTRYENMILWRLTSFAFFSRFSQKVESYRKKD